MKTTIITIILMFFAILGFAQGDISSQVRSSGELFNSSWRNEQTGDWVLSLFDDCAAYDSKLWKYADKSDKKVILTDGTNNIIISIGKKNARKREFTIGDKKIMLSEITTNTLPDYPTADSTAFNTKLWTGEATITGFISNLPEMFQSGRINVKCCVSNYIKAMHDQFNARVGKKGRFTLKVPLFGINEVHLHIQDYYVPMVLEPGKKYFVMCDWRSGGAMFMGEDARLQNELQGKWNVISEAHSHEHMLNDSSLAKRSRENEVKYQNMLSKLQQVVVEHPTISKRYRDLMRVANRYAVCNMMMNIDCISLSGNIPDETDKWISKNGYLDPKMPFALTEAMGLYLNMRLSYEARKIFNKYYYLGPDQLLERVQDGKLKLDNDDVETIKLWLGYEKEEKVFRQNENKDERVFLQERARDKYHLNNKIIPFTRRSDIKAITNNDAPERTVMEKAVLDSLFGDKRVYQFALSTWLMRSMNSRMDGLPKEMYQYLDDVKDTALINRISERMELYAKMKNEEYSEIQPSLRSVSDVEGLTDGKAILEKILEPFKGKFVHIDFWGTWCGGCIQQLQGLPRLKSELKDYDMVYLYFANNSNEMSWKQMISQFDLYGGNCVHYNLPKAQEKALEKYLNVQSFPTYFLVDKHGNVHNMGNAVMADVLAYKRTIEELNKE